MIHKEIVKHNFLKHIQITKCFSEDIFDMWLKNLNIVSVEYDSFSFCDFFKHIILKSRGTIKYIDFCIPDLIVKDLPIGAFRTFNKQLLITYYSFFKKAEYFLYAFFHEISHSYDPLIYSQYGFSNKTMQYCGKDLLQFSDKRFGLYPICVPMREAVADICSVFCLYDVDSNNDMWKITSDVFRNDVFCNKKIMSIFGNTFSFVNSIFDYSYSLFLCVKSYGIIDLTKKWLEQTNFKTNFYNK